jgi:hypothetical protein
MHFRPSTRILQDGRRSVSPRNAYVKNRFWSKQSPTGAIDEGLLLAVVQPKAARPLS